MKSLKKMFDFKKNLKSVFNFVLVLGLIFGASVLVRLPHFLSPDFFFDGDEGLIGIMAQDFLNGKGLPIYFYGQNYGFSTIEVLSTSIFIKIFGSGIWALRLGGLLIFSIALTFISQVIFKSRLSKIYSFFVIVILVIVPTWFLWGAMVRGGYVTALMCISILFYVTQLKKFNWQWLLFSAFIFAIGYESQLLVLIPIIPFLIIWMKSEKIDFKKVAGFIFLICTVVFVIKFFGENESVWSAPKAVFFDIKQIENLFIQLKGFLFGYSNFFFFTMDIPIPVWWSVLLWVSLVLIAIYIIVFWKEAEKKKKSVILIGILVLLFSIGLISTVSLYSPRYWLGFFTGLLLLFVYAVINGRATKVKSVIVVLITIIFSFGIISSKEMKRDWYQVNVNEMDAITALYKVAKNRNVEAVFIADPVLQWKWNYLFGREIPGTFFSENERTNEFKNNVFQKFKQDSTKTAIVGLYGFYNGLDEFESFKQNCNQIATKYYIMDKVEKQFITISMAKFN